MLSASRLRAPTTSLMHGGAVGCVALVAIFLSDRVGLTVGYDGTICQDPSTLVAHTSRYLVRWSELGDGTCGALNAIWQADTRSTGNPCYAEVADGIPWRSVILRAAASGCCGRDEASRCGLVSRSNKPKKSVPIFLHPGPLFPPRRGTIRSVTQRMHP